MNQQRGIPLTPGPSPTLGRGEPIFASRWRSSQFTTVPEPRTCSAYTKFGTRRDTLFCRQTFNPLKDSVPQYPLRLKSRSDSPK